MNRGIKLSFAMSLGFCGLTGVSGTILTSPSLSATEISASTSANATVTVAEACTMTSGSNNDSPHAATIPAGTSQSDIGLTTFKVVCNDTGGFSVYAVGYANKEEGNTKLLANVGGNLTPAYDINTGLATSGNTSAWAMKLTAASGSYSPTIQSDSNGSFASYHIVPSTSTKVVTYNGVTDAGNNAVGSVFTSTYRAFVTGTQPAGTYNGKVKYTMVHPATSVPNEPKDCAANSICYWPNAENRVSDTMGNQSVGASDTEATLWASNFSYSGYGFAGWSDAYDYVANVGSASDPSAHIYGPNETITLPPDMSDGLSLYAIWVPNQGNLQGWTGCSSLNQGKVTALTDQRDGQTYAVAKLADGNCWMIENLRLDDSSELGLTNTNNPSLPITNDFDAGIVSNHLSPTTALSDPWCNTETGACINQSKIQTDNVVAAINNMTSTNQNIYSYGVYYNWYSATAGNGTYSLVARDVAGGDICPIGWHLPFGFNNTGSSGGNTSGGIYYLTYVLNNNSNPETATSSNIVRVYPNNFVYSGYNDANDTYSRIDVRGTDGHYWTLTAANSNNAYRFRLSDSEISSGAGYARKYDARAVRCVHY